MDYSWYVYPERIGTEEDKAKRINDSFWNVFRDWASKHQHVVLVGNPTKPPEPQYHWVDDKSKPHTWITLKNASTTIVEVKPAARELPRCECGAGACGSAYHSDWCPLA